MVSKSINKKGVENQISTPFFISFFGLGIGTASFFYKKDTVNSPTLWVSP